MAIMTTPLADRSHGAISQISLRAPELLLEDGRLVHFLGKLNGCSAGGRCAWELVFTSLAAPEGPRMDARLIAHTSLPAPQRAMLQPTAVATRQQLLDTLCASGIEAQEAPDALPTLRAPRVITLYKQGCGLLKEEAVLTAGLLRQRLCAAPGSGISLLLVQSAWQEDELDACTAGESEARRSMLAREGVFDFVVTLWGPGAEQNAAWLRGLTLNCLTECTPANPVLYPICLRRDPWHLLTLLPPNCGSRPTLLTLSELLTLCGCPAEPGEMQRMCRMSWRETASDALEKAQLSLLPMDMTLQPGDLRFMGLQSDADLTGALGMTGQMSEMLRMCVAILRQLGAMEMTEYPKPESAPQTAMLGYLLPAVGHIYEQFVRECCYQTMHGPYYTHATGRKPAQVTRVYLAVYDQGPPPRYYRLQRFAPDATDPAMQAMIRERMIDDFTACAMIDGQPMPDTFWYELFNDMNTARSQRNGLAHEVADLRTAHAFARAFLLDRPGAPSLLRRLLMCRRITMNFPAT